MTSTEEVKTPARPTEKTCRSTDWLTPPRVLEPVRRMFGGQIWLDPCTTPGNPTKAVSFYSKQSDGLRDRWHTLVTARHGVFVNPPYGKAMRDWIAKCVEEADRGVPIALLLAASSRWDQPYWHAIFSPECTAMVLFKGRVKYLDARGRPAKSPPYPSILFVYNVDHARVRAAFPPTDKVVEIGAR